MTLRRASIVLPAARLEDFPTHLVSREAAELLAAWTALWHPALIAAVGTLPGWHPADDAPDPTEFDGELLLIPTASRRRLAEDWYDRLRATFPRNPLPVEPVASRRQTLAAVLSAAGLDADRIPHDIAADFLALGHAHLQVELLTRAMHYTSVLDTDQLENATVAAAEAALAGETDTVESELARAFDLVADARNHVYSVDFYVVDLTLLAPSTLGEPLRSKLASAVPTNLLITGQLLEQMAHEQPESLAALRHSIAVGCACPVGGLYHNVPPRFASPESLLSELEKGQEAANRYLGRELSEFAQFGSAFSSRMPETLCGMGFVGALHAAFDGGKLPKADQCKTWWGPKGAAIQALASTPLDIARPETWLRFAKRIGDTIAYDHVATIVLAGWPGSSCEFYDDLRRASKYGPLLGKLVTLEEYFRTTREPDEWTRFHPSEYPDAAGSDFEANSISARVERYRADVVQVHDSLTSGMASICGLAIPGSANIDPAHAMAMNSWNFPRPLFVGCDPLDLDASRSGSTSDQSGPTLLAAVSGCGYATLRAAAAPPPASLAVGRTLRNERLELTVSETTGGIQSLRAHRDRGTRVSQRLVCHGHFVADPTQMVAERIDITRNDSALGEITSQGRLLNSTGDLLARFTQRVRIARALPAAIVDVELIPERAPSGDTWRSYFASRIAWADPALVFRRGVQWIGRETSRLQIESPEWVEVQDGIGAITCFGLGLPFHRRVDPSWLDTLLVVAGEAKRRFQFALALDDPHPEQTALALLTAGPASIAQLPQPPSSPTGWFLHIGAKNVLITHLEPLPQPQAGIRLRLLETDGRDTHSRLSAFRSLRAARTTDFRGQPAEVLSVTDGRAAFDIAAHRWIQIEAEW